MKIKITLLFYFIQFSLYAQGINNLWVMGYQSWAGRPYGGINLNFTGGAMDTSYHNRKMNFDETNGVICDKNGNFLFSSNGVCIINADNDTMKNGKGLNPSLYTSLYDSIGLTVPQANLIIPFPADSNKYYLFHETIDDYGISWASFYLYYTVIDMTQDGGKGAVSQKNIVLLNDSLVPGRLTACKHANGRDWWLIAHKYNSDIYYKYLITPSGINGSYIQSIGVNRQENIGQCVFSPDGSKFAYYEPEGDLDLMDFDRCTGDFSNLVHVDINDSATSAGVAFSPNSNVLYLSSRTYMYQFDVSAADIPSSQITIATWDGYYSPHAPFATTFYLSQLAPDGKIYIICGNSTVDIHVINYPDNVGMSSGMCQHCVRLPAYNAFTIANHPNYFLGAETGSICDTLTGMQNVGMQNAELKIYPNPIITEDITFTYAVSSEQGVLIIYNVEGKEITQYSIPQWSSVQHLRLPEISSGVYLARLTQGGIISNTKFIKE